MSPKPLYRNLNLELDAIAEEETSISQPEPILANQVVKFTEPTLDAQATLSPVQETQLQIENPLPELTYTKVDPQVQDAMDIIKELSDVFFLSVQVLFPRIQLLLSMEKLAFRFYFFLALKDSSYHELKTMLRVNDLDDLEIEEHAMKEVFKFIDIHYKKTGRKTTNLTTKYFMSLFNDGLTTLRRRYSPVSNHDILHNGSMRDQRWIF